MPLRATAAILAFSSRSERQGRVSSRTSPSRNTNALELCREAIDASLGAPDKTRTA